jgi:hypothetical protein
MTMRESRFQWLAVGLLAVLAFGLSCTSNDLDDADAADVILEVVTLDNPPVEVRCSLSTDGQCSVGGAFCTSNADCQAGVEVCIFNQVCQLEVTDWDATIAAQPKNTLAIPPYNDLILQNVTIAYAWLDPALTTPVRTVGLGNTVVPAQGTSQVSFAPIALDDLTPDKPGHTANLTLTFNAITVEGTRVSETVGRQLHVEDPN